MAQIPSRKWSVASVCLIAVLYNYEQWRDLDSGSENEIEMNGNRRGLLDTYAWDSQMQCETYVRKRTDERRV